ncbi:hypothetical protein Tco_0430277, partial [Tanacetum coccineum]
DLVDVLHSVRSVIAPGKAIEFLSDTLRKDDAEMAQLRELEMLMNDINKLQDLSNLLAMHLSQRNTPLSPYSPNLL